MNREGRQWTRVSTFSLTLEIGRAVYAGKKRNLDQTWHVDSSPLTEDSEQVQGLAPCSPLLPGSKSDICNAGSGLEILK